MTRQPLAFLPGLLCDQTLFARQMQDLAPVADVWCASYPDCRSVSDMAARVLEAMPEQFALCGLSMGGYVAFEIWRQAPERITGMVLMDTQAADDSMFQRERRLKFMAQAKVGRFMGVTKQLLPLLVHENRLTDQPLIDVIQAAALNVGRQGFENQQTAILERPDSRPILSTITCRTLMIVGRQDALTPVEDAETIARGIPDCRLEVLEDCGHLASLEKPDEVSALITGFLHKLPGN